MMSKTVQICVVLTLIQFSLSTHVNPQTFLDSRLAKGMWIEKESVIFAEHLFEGGWVWDESGKLEVTHICRARSEGFGGRVSINPGELVNGTCYVAGKADLTTLTGVHRFQNYEVLMKSDDEVYEWVAFDRESGHVPHGAVIGGLGQHYEPLLVCRKVFNGTAGEIRKSKAVLGQFSPSDGKCFYELESWGDWIKWDLSYASDDIQLLVLKARGPQPCAEPRMVKKFGGQRRNAKNAETPLNKSKTS